MTSMLKTTQIPYLTLLIFLPIIGTVLLTFIRKTHSNLFRLTAQVTAFFSLVLSIFMVFILDKAPIVERFDWIPSLGIHYQLTLDGLNVWLLLITNLMCAIILFLTATRQTFHRSEAITLLLLTSTVNGIFLSSDLFLFLLFWGMSTGPIFFLFTIHAQNRSNTGGIRFFLMHAISTLALLTGFIILYFSISRMKGINSFDFMVLSRFSISKSMQAWVFWLLLSGFFIRSAILPFHGWLKEFVDDAPFSISLFIASVFIKTGIYGIIKFCLPLCPDASIRFSQVVVYIALTTIIYTSLVALMQPDIKKILVLSCSTYMGFSLLGVFALNSVGLNGAVLHLINHSLSFTVLFIIAELLYSRFNSSLMMDYGGVIRRFPVMAIFFFLAGLSYLGLPGLNCFISFFMIFSGAVASQPVWAIISMFGYLLSAAGILWMFQQIFLGTESEISAKVKIPDWFRERGMIVLLFILFTWVGFFPGILLKDISHSNQNWINTIKSRRILSEPALQPPGNRPFNMKNLPGYRSPVRKRN